MLDGGGGGGRLHAPPDGHRLWQAGRQVGPAPVGEHNPGQHQDGDRQHPSSIQRQARAALPHPFPYRFSEGITLELRQRAGAVENLRLPGPFSSDDLAFSQGGIAPVEGGAKVRAIASVFLEPLWLLTRGPAEPESISSLKGLRMAVGAAGSSTHELIKERCVLPDIS